MNSARWSRRCGRGIRPSAGSRRRGSSPAWNVTPLDWTASGTNGRGSTSASTARGDSLSLCEFEIDDEDAAFAYAEERVRASASRLAVTNRSSEAVHAMANALRAHDIDGAFVHISDAYVYDDRRRLSGDPIHGLAELRVAVERILVQYNHFEWRTLAVRGERISLRRAAGPMTPGTRRPTCTCSRSATTG